MLPSLSKGFTYLLTCLLRHTQATQAHYRHVDVTLACEQFCVTNEYLEALRLVWDVNGFS